VRRRSDDIVANGHCKATEEEGDQTTPGKELLKKRKNKARWMTGFRYSGGGGRWRWQHTNKTEVDGLKCLCPVLH